MKNDKKESYFTLCNINIIIQILASDDNIIILSYAPRDLDI